MSSVLSEISNRLQISSIKDAVTDAYDTMFHKLNKVKDVFSKQDPEILPKIIKEAAPVKDEGYVSPVAPAKPKTPGEIFKATLIKIKDFIWEYGSKLLIIMFYLYLASLVANDMIIYAAPIRAFFFIFTLFVTTTFFPAAIAVAFYYLLKKGYDYYNQNLSSATVKPPLCFPMIYAILPLTTYYPTSPFVRFFLWIFMYQKSDKPERMKKENERLEIIMKNYWNDLNGSFEYLDKIKDTPPFKDFYEIIEKKLTIEGMHPIQKPEKVAEPSKASDAIGDAKTALPATIASQTNSTLPATNASQTKTALPATIASQTNSTLPATNASQTKTALPATIASQTNSTLPATNASQTNSILPNNTKAEVKATAAKATNIIAPVEPVAEVKATAAKATNIIAPVEPVAEVKVAPLPPTI
jgi:hypothetical protein